MDDDDVIGDAATALDPRLRYPSRHDWNWISLGDEYWAWLDAAYLMINRLARERNEARAEVEAMRGEVESQERAHAEEIARYQARIAEAHHAHAGALDKLAWLGHVHSASSRCAACAAYDARQAATQGPGPLERTVFEPKDRTPAPSGEKGAT